MRSMTGFGSGDAPFDGGRVVVEARAVNHRFLDVRTRLPVALSERAGLFEDLLRKALGRGRVEASVRIEGRADGGLRLDEARAMEAYRALDAVRLRLGLSEPAPMALLASVPGLFTEQSGPDADELLEALTRATAAACASLDAMREREGATLAGLLTGHVANIRALTRQAEGLAPAAVDNHRERLRERLDRLLADAGVALDAGRLEHEVALFADRADVREELDRLLGHADQFDELVASDGAVGRKLDFLLQELGREANTLGAKSVGLPLTRVVVELKAEIERLREQVQNVL